MMVTSRRWWWVVVRLILVGLAVYLGEVMVRLEPRAPVRLSAPVALTEAPLEPIVPEPLVPLPRLSEAVSPRPQLTPEPSLHRHADQTVWRHEASELAFVRQLLKVSLSRHLPHLDLSAPDDERLAHAVLRLRDAHMTLRQLPVSLDHVEALQQGFQEKLEALAEFETITGLGLNEFTRMVQPDVGITEEDNDDAEVVFEPLAMYPPPR